MSMIGGLTARIGSDRLNESDGPDQAAQQERPGLWRRDGMIAWSSHCDEAVALRASRTTWGPVSKAGDLATEVLPSRSLSGDSCLMGAFGCFSWREAAQTHAATDREPYLRGGEEAL